MEKETQMSFSVAVERVLGHEGGYVNHPADPGGETNWGITIGTARENGYMGDMKTMNRNEAIVIYKRAFWDKNLCNEMPFAVAFQVFDGCVNHGAGNAARWLQKAVGAHVDGSIGKETVYKTNASDPVKTILNMSAERMLFYTGIPQWNHFGKGWINRMAGNARYAAIDLR
jgi:lysozyme family protein